MARLFFTCPTDFLETTIENTFQEEKLFKKVLANSLDFESNELDEIMTIVASRDVDEVTFVLSSENRLFTEGMSEIPFNNLKGVSSFCKQFTGPEDAIGKDQESNVLEPIMSYYLLQKVERFCQCLKQKKVSDVIVNALVYCSITNAFQEVVASGKSKQALQVN